MELHFFKQEKHDSNSTVEQDKITNKKFFNIYMKKNKKKSCLSTNSSIKNFQLYS